MTLLFPVQLEVLPTMLDCDSLVVYNHYYVISKMTSCIYIYICIYVYIVQVIHKIKFVNIYIRNVHMCMRLMSIFVALINSVDMPTRLV